MYQICPTPSDDIGQGGILAARWALEGTGLPLHFVDVEVGWIRFQTVGTSPPQETVDKISDSDATLADAFTSPRRPSRQLHLHGRGDRSTRVITPPANTHRESCDSAPPDTLPIP